MLSVNHKTPNYKHTKNKKYKNKHPLKVVYITNPIKFNTSASQFRALVQELTGQDADPPENAESPAADTVKVVADGDRVHALEEVTKIGQSTNGDDHQVVEKGSDPSVSGSYDDVFCAPEMMQNSNLWHEAFLS
ncbi:hypothetical protein BUALT_Bualt16G0113200 [Buddleja alternifolia]|uniref:VQ domain-containing protein n=1 Tax=Buddleja alternifolia TaxID=168488 RepID=A0AAV6WAV6_9LAMI|nr:hypothetical protein BUALT_Bualt16G0113200 [Buddleja alternifolia]